MKFDLDGFVRRRFRYLLFLLLGGTLLAYVAVYKFFAQPRQFKGDFYAAMYEPSWWDGTGLFYGPLFVFERWFVNDFPGFATVGFFSVQVLLLIITTLFIALKTVHADKSFVIFGLFVWCFNSYFYYSYSVAANPEMLELFFLLVMWWAITRKFIMTAHIFFALAVITKIVPIVLLPILFFNFNPYGLLVMALILIGSIILVSIGQNENTFSILKDLLPASVDPQPMSEQFLGLSNAMSRLTGSVSTADFRYTVFFAMAAIVVIYILVIYVGYRFHKTFGGSKYEVSVAYGFSIFMCLMPLMHTSNTHRHTFLFLAPIWIALRFICQSDNNMKRSRILSRIFTGYFIAYSLLPIYFLDVFPVPKLLGVHLGETSFSYVMFSEPIWTNLAILATIIYYGVRIIRDNSELSIKMFNQESKNNDR